MRSQIYTTLLITLLTTTVRSSPAEAPVPGFTLAWSDTFSTGSLDTSKWTRFSGTPSNHEQESYPANSNNCGVTPQGTFLITPENNNGVWTSCRIESIPAFTAPTGGQMIVQARFRLGNSAGAQLQGIWPAFWSLGDAERHGTSWPECGEIDTFENVNGDALGYGTVHCGVACNDPTGLQSGIGFSYADFHTWAHVINLTSGDWTQQSITWYMDGQAYHVVRGSDVGDWAAWKAMAQSPMYMIANVAVGGSWPGDAAGDTVSGAAAGMEIEYVGVYTG